MSVSPLTTHSSSLIDVLIIALVLLAVFLPFSLAAALASRRAKKTKAPIAEADPELRARKKVGVWYGALVIVLGLLGAFGAAVGKSTTGVVICLLLVVAGIWAMVRLRHQLKRSR